MYECAIESEESNLNSPAAADEEQPAAADGATASLSTKRQTILQQLFARDSLTPEDGNGNDVLAESKEDSIESSIALGVTFTGEQQQQQQQQHQMEKRHHQPVQQQQSSITQLYGTYHLRDSDSDDDFDFDSGGNDSGRDTDATAESAVSTDNSTGNDNSNGNNSSVDRSTVPRKTSRTRRQTVFGGLLPIGLWDGNIDDIDDDVIFDTVQYDFYTFVFIRQLLVHIFFFLYPCLLENPNAQEFGLRHRLQAQLYNWILPLCVYVMVLSYFATASINSEILSGAVYMPLILFLQHRTSVALKYAFLSNTEYKRFTHPFITTEQARKYQKQMQLITGWMYRNETVLEFELGAAATRIGAKVNEIHVVINSPLKSKSDYNQYHYWNAFMLGNELIDTTVDHAKEMVKLADGSFAISVYDLSRAIISRADRSYDSYELLKEISICSYVLVNVAIPLVHLASSAAQIHIDAWLVLFVVTSTVVNIVFGYIVLSILYVAVIDVLRLWNMLWDANEIIRTSDALMTTGAVKNKRRKTRRKLKKLVGKEEKRLRAEQNLLNNSNGNDSTGNYSINASNNTNNNSSSSSTRKEIRSQRDTLEREKSMRVSNSIMTISKENKLAQRSPDKLLIKHASLRDVPKYTAADYRSTQQQQQQQQQQPQRQPSTMDDTEIGATESAKERKVFFWSDPQQHSFDAVADAAQPRDIEVQDSPYSITHSSTDQSQQQQQQQKLSPHRPLRVGSSNKLHAVEDVVPTEVGEAAALEIEATARAATTTSAATTTVVDDQFEPSSKAPRPSYISNMAVRASRRVSWFRIGKVKEDDDEYNDDNEEEDDGRNKGHTFISADSICDVESGRRRSSSNNNSSRRGSSNSNSRSSMLRQRRSHRPAQRSSARDSIAEVGENIAENGAPALLPRVPIANTSNHQNIIAWTYTRLLLQHFGIRFRWRIDFNVAVTISLTVVLMVYALVLIFTAKEQRSQFLTSYFLQSLLNISISIGYLWTILCIGTLINRMMLFHSQALAYYQSRVNRRILLCEYLPELAAEYVPLKSLRKFISYAMDIIEASNIANPFRILGMDAVPSLTATVLTSAVSFYGLIVSLYLNAETDVQASGSTATS